jgi:hypothetical protein
MLNKEWLQALDGNVSAMTALNAAKEQAIVLSNAKAVTTKR